MTDRLSSLLHDEADALDIPAPPAATVLTRGRRLRRRHRATYGVAGFALATVLGTAVLASGGGDGGSEAIDAADPGGSLHGVAFSVGTTVYLDGGARQASIDDKAIKSSYYTSAGLLVRHGDNNFSDGGGPQRFSLVTSDGTVKPVSVVTEETVPGVDPAQPYLAFAEVRDGEVQVVVHDISTDEEVARVPVPGTFEWGGWSAPPVALNGDTVYVGTDDVMRTVDWRTGEIGETDVVQPGYLAIRGGRAVQSAKDRSVVVDVVSGESLLSVEVRGFGSLSLSPDGRFATMDSGKDFDVYDVDAGSHTTFDGSVYDYGWTPEGDLVRLRDGHLVTCSATSGDCVTGTDTIPAKGGGVAPRDVRFAGQIFES